MDRRTVFGGAAAAVTAAGTSSILPGAAVAAGGAPQVPTTKLGSLEVSQTIQGYWQLAGGHGPVRARAHHPLITERFDRSLRLPCL